MRSLLQLQLPTQWVFRTQTVIRAKGPMAAQARGIAGPYPHSENRKKIRKENGIFGSDFFGGGRPKVMNAKEVDLPKEPYDPTPYRLDFVKYPEIACGLGAQYYYRDGQKSPLSYFHIRKSLTGDESVAVGSTDPRARESRTIDNYVKEHNRGFAVQILLEGRGVKAYFDPKPPHLKVRLGVGAKLQSLEEYCVRDPDCTVSCNSRGNVVVVHGPNKARVGTLAYRLLRKMQPKLQPYTGKGAHFPFHPVKRKVVKKK
mmetsp:Transcript_41210/g.92544  ORF Transcript_41210/g.92544 Transcript_41210/m.92544 type:complete len:258 (-) Transcript_41210:71-844(-)